jgi:hypothetical protein
MQVIYHKMTALKTLLHIEEIIQGGDNSEEILNNNTSTHDETTTV